MGPFLLGYAAEFGAYAFDLRDKLQVKPLLPTAEYATRESGAMFQLFLAEIAPGQYQALYTSFDYDAGEEAFQIQPLLEKTFAPQCATPCIGPQQQPDCIEIQRWFLAVGVDMAQGKSVDLPKEIATQPVQAILKWMKKQRLSKEASSGWRHAP